MNQQQHKSAFNLLFFSSLLLLLLFTVNGHSRELVFNATGIITDDIGSDFTLKGPNQKPVTLSDYQGKIVLLYFGYTSCPDVCPMSLSIMQRAMDRLGDKTSEVQGVFVTVDPSRDGGEDLQTYVKYFHHSFIGLEGSDSEIQQIAKKWNVAYKVEQSSSAAGYLIAHTDYIYVLDRNGDLAALFNSESHHQDMVNAIETLVNEPPATLTDKFFKLFN